MHSRFVVILTGIVSVCGAAVVLSLAWVLSLPLRWLLELEMGVSMGLSIAALGIVAVIVHAIATYAPESGPWDVDEDSSEENGLTEGEEGGEQANWFRNCLCGSGRTFARCCGRRAFKREQR